MSARTEPSWTPRHLGFNSLVYIIKKNLRLILLLKKQTNGRARCSVASMCSMLRHTVMPKTKTAEAILRAKFMRGGAWYRPFTNTSIGQSDQETKWCDRVLWARPFSFFPSSLPLRGTTLLQPPQVCSLFMVDPVVWLRCVASPSRRRAP